ncbi:MAG: hypothetical protein E7666_03295 [Ruminococcaceae bacterium]|nr:hypothetical protein [Oscillospiraceae bacterium]
MQNLKSTLFAAALLIAGAILVGFSLLADSTLIFLGFGCMLVGVLLPFSGAIANYFRSFSAENDERDKK